MSNRKNAEAAAGKTTDRRRESLFAMRLFIAILLSEEMKKALTDAQQAMVDRGVRGRYSPEENLHLTLAFIGDYPDAQPVLDALNTVSFRPFDLSLEGIGCFGDLWWAGLKDSLPLAAVARRVRRALAESEPVGMRVQRLSLMRSDRGRNGMLYTELGTVEAALQEEVQP